MISMIGHVIFGLIIGVVASYLVKGGHHPWYINAVVGMAGGWLGGFTGKALGWYKEGEAAGFLMSVVGAMALFVLLRYIP